MSKQYIDEKGNKINIKPTLKNDTKRYGFYKLDKNFCKDVKIMQVAPKAEDELELFSL